MSPFFILIESEILLLISTRGFSIFFFVMKGIVGSAPIRNAGYYPVYIEFGKRKCILLTHPGDFIVHVA